MSLTITKEDGTGKADANSYASVADGDAYHEAHLYATAWTDATSAKKAAALVMATRLIEAEWQFNGAKATSAQALQWPRARCLDPDADGQRASALFALRGPFLPADAVPAALVRAACEQARELLIVDRTANPMGEGLKSSQLGDMQQVFDKTDRRPVLSRVVQAMLTKYGCAILGGGGAVKLLRV